MEDAKSGSELGLNLADVCLLSCGHQNQLLLALRGLCCGPRPMKLKNTSQTFCLVRKKLRSLALEVSGTSEQACEAPP
jgi:hypothetical protein